MKRYKKVGKDCIIQVGDYTIRPSELKDASSYIGRMDLPMGLVLRDGIISQRGKIQIFQKSPKDYCFTILEKQEVIGLIELEPKIGTRENEAFVKILLPSRKDKEKQEEIEEIFIKLLKKMKVYYKVYIYRYEKEKMFTREVEIA